MSTYRLQVREPRGTLHDVFVGADEASPTAQLEAEIEAIGFRAKPLGIGGRSLASVRTVGDLALEHGDVVECGRLGLPTSWPGAGTYVVVVAGPDAGRWQRIAPGQRLTVGRDTDGMRVADSLMSARHCSFELTDDGTVLVADAGSTNGTFVEHDEVTADAQLPRGGYVQAGSSVLTVVEVDSDDIAVLGEPEGGAAVLPRQFRRALPALPERLDPPQAREPEKADHGSMWWRSVLPLVTGAGFALMTGRWIFLLIMAIAPIIFTYDALKRHRRDARRHETAHAKYVAELDRFAAELTELRVTERRRRRHAVPSGGLAPFEMAGRAARLWERAPSDADFLDVVVGLGTLPSAITAKVPDGVTVGDLRWGTPVRTNLRTTGSLAIVGEHRFARPVARGIVLGLAATHSAADVRLTVLCDDADGDDWGFARWLPHTFQGDHGCRIGADRDSRAALFTSLSQLLDTRREFAERDSKIPLPIHVVVIDDTELLTPEELTEVLVHGPAHGIVAVTVDQRLSPEGAGATLTIPAGATALDHCMFQSRHQPRLDDVIVAAVHADVAEASARRIAGLRPTMGDEQGIAGGVVHLVDLLEEGGTITPDAVRLRWDTIGPRTAVPVGAATGTTMVVDLVRDGPHGLVGGTSGSGKTEFLKTLFCGLALNNHPDDLSIVIVDFKGGVDHEAVKPLPHVIDVATNLDIEQFKRTIVLLKAESMRRQDLLASAGASNIDSYRLARANKPELPPLPRLLVVVDEFGELLASEGGREQLKELESITRIGRALGLHLLLVTQNFDGNLPAQIDANAGMRVCLRVQKPAHSKAVLDSGVAATIADRNVGRAYARFHGRDLVEFQTARVAGRRRDLAGATSPVTARLVPFSVLASAPPESRPEDVPVEETDMYVILQSIAAAAAATGWERSAVPWPAGLPEQISLLSLGGRSPDGVTAIGVADLPEQQRRGLCTFADRDQQVALLGGPSAPLPEILTTYATALAVGRSPDDVHVYGIDLIGRSLAQLADLPHCGGVAVRNDNLALRMLRWLTQVVAERKAAVATSGSSTVWEHAALTGQLPPQIVLLVSGADRLLSTSDGPTSNLLGPLVGLMTEAIGVRVQIVLAGLPKIVAHRLGMNIERRFVFQLADPGEYGGLGAPKSARADLLVPRRGVETATGRLVQFAQLAAPGEPEGALVRSIAAQLPAAAVQPPKVFADITWPMPWSAAPFGTLAAPAHMVVPVPVGIDTEEGGWLWIDAEDDGPVFSVVGGPRSGRSAALHAIARLATGQGHSVLNVALSRRSPLSTSDDPALGRRVAPGQVAAALAETPGRVVVLYDDLQRLPDSDCIEAAAAERERVLMVVSGAPDFLDSRSGLLRPLPPSRAGIVLAPTGNYDGNAVGLKRVPADAMLNPRPGRGLLVVGGEPVEIQVPHVAAPATV